MLKAKKENRVVRIPDEKVGEYKKLGYSIFTMDGELVHEHVDPSVKLLNLQKENADLKAKLENLRHENDELNSEVTYLREQLKKQECSDDSGAADAGKKTGRASTKASK